MFFFDFAMNTWGLVSIAIVTSIFFESIPSGYAKRTTLISKEKDYAIFRKFSTLNTQNLLYLQAELTNLESRLLEINIKADQSDDRSAILSSWQKFTENEDRRAVAQNIRATLEAYSTHRNVIYSFPNTYYSNIY